MDANSTRSRTVSVEAKPEPITIDLTMTAALVVDMQNDFAAKGGMFERAGMDISITRAAIAPTARALAAIRQAGIGVIYLKMGFRPDLSDLGPPGSPNRIKHLPGQVGTTVTAPDGRESRILIRDTWNTDILDELKPKAGIPSFTRRDTAGSTEPSSTPFSRGGDQIVSRHGRDDLRMRRLDDSRRDVQRLYVHPAGRLHRRAPWQPVYEKQSRSRTSDDPDVVRLALHVSRPHQVAASVTMQRRTR